MRVADNFRGSKLECVRQWNENYSVAHLDRADAFFRGIILERCLR